MAKKSLPYVTFPSPGNFFLRAEGCVRAIAFPVTVRAHKQVRKQQNAALHVETVSCHQVTLRPEVADSHRLKRFGQGSNFSISSMLRSSLGTLARLLNGFKDGKLLQGLEGPSNLQLFNPVKNCFLAYVLAKRNSSKGFYDYTHLQSMQCSSPDLSF